MKYITLLSVALLTACVIVPKQESTQITQQLDSKGNLISETRTESASVATDREIEITRRDCIASEESRYSGTEDATAIVAIAAINALRVSDPCAAGTNSNDVVIAANEQRTRQIGSVTGVLPVLGSAVAAAVVGKAAVESRDATVVTQPAPLVVNPEIVTTPAPEVVVIEPFVVPTP
jgi:sulfate adenylyltransferase subunit 1 (EFTu-like GTPase family)